MKTINIAKGEKEKKTMRAIYKVNHIKFMLRWAS